LPEPRPITLGSATCWHVGDLLALLKFVAGESESPTPGTKPSPVKAALQFLSGFRPGIHPDLFRWHDPLPALVELLPYCKRAIEAIRRNRLSYAGAMRILFPTSAYHVSQVKSKSE
jgi:hypothetical protein